MSNNTDPGNVATCGGQLFCYDTPQDAGLDITIKLLSWFLIAGLATSVDFETFRKRLREKAILVGLSCQFFLFPLVGFGCVILFNLSQINATVLLILVSSPGGSYSNLWCSMWNADLALSVAMTSVSTICSLFMLPWNLFLYVNTLYPLTQPACGANSTGCTPAETEWATIGFTLGLVISAVLAGLFFGEKYPDYKDKANFIGNICGLLSIVLSVFVSSASDTPPWEQPIEVIIACGLPLVVGLTAAVSIGICFKLEKPQAVAIGIETAYQSVTIALIYAFGQGEEGRAAVGLTVIYGTWEVVIFGIFCTIAWQLGWTYSPSRKVRDLPNILFLRHQKGDSDPEMKDAEGKVVRTTSGLGML